MDVANINDVPSFTTKDGSEIRELLAWRNSCIRNQSLAEARVATGLTTEAHRHLQTEEIYYILKGAGIMYLGEQSQEVGPGDAIAIPPGTEHKITCTSKETLVFLCCCAPGYEHEDTELTRGNE